MVASGSYSQFRNQMPLAAGAFGFTSLLLSAINIGSQDLRIGLAGLSAGTLGLVGFYDNRPRQLVYLNGALALSCAIAANEHLIVPEETAGSLNKQTTALQTAVSRLKLDVAKNASRTSAAYSNDQARHLVADANSLLQSVAIFRYRRAHAAIPLRAYLIEIVAAVDAQVVKTDPDPQAINAVLSGIGDAFPKLPESSGVAASGDTAKAGGADEFDKDAQAVVDATDELRKTFDMVSAGADDVRKTLANCKVPDVPGALRIEPDETSHTIISLPTTLVYSIRGGALPISVGVSGEFPADAFKTSTSTKDGTMTVSVDISTGAKGHEATLNVADANNTSGKHIKINVSDAAKVTEKKDVSQQQAEKQKTTPSVPTVSKLTPQRVSMVRLVVGIDPGAAPAPALTRDEQAKVDKFAVDNGKTKDLKRGSELYRLIVAKARATAQGLPNTDPIEVALLQGNKIATLRTVCGLPSADGPDRLDKELHAKLFDYEEAAQKGVATEPDIDGKLDSEAV